MGRPNKDIVDFFPHFCKPEDNVRIIENQYKSNGYACWFKLQELIGRTSNYQLNLDDEKHSEKILLMFSECGIEEELGYEILKRFAKLSMINKDAFNNHKIIWCQSFIDELHPIWKKRKVSAPEISISGARTPLPPPKTPLPPPKTLQSRVEYRREEEDYPEAFRLAGVLANEILTFNPYHIELRQNKKDCIAAWTLPINKLLQKYKQPSERVEKVIKYIYQEDTFWYGNILCGKTFAKQYNKVVTQMVANSKGEKPKSLSGAKKEKAYEDAKRKLDSIEQTLFYAQEKLNFIGEDHPEYKETKERVDKLNKAHDYIQNLLNSLGG